MQFMVLNKPTVEPSTLPKILNVLTPLKCSNKKRTLTLMVVGDPTKPVEFLLDGQKWNSLGHKNTPLSSDRFLFFNLSTLRGAYHILNSAVSLNIP